MNIAWHELDHIQKRGLLTALALWFLMQAGFFLLIPLLSIHYVDELGWAAAFIGLVLAVRQFTQQGLTVFGGALADRFGAKGLILAGMTIRTASFVMMGFATTKPLLMAAGILAALGGSLFDSPSRAVVAALAPEKMLPAIYARVGILQNAARTIGPMLGALLISVNFQIVGLAAAGFFFIGVLVTAVFLPNVSVSVGNAGVSKGLNIAFHDRAFLTYLVLMMGFWFMWVQVSIALPLQAKALTNSNSSVGILLTVNAIAALLLQIPALKLAQKYLKPLPMLTVGILIMAVGLGSVALVQSIWHLYAAIIFFALGTVLVMPNAQTVVATMADPRARGAYMGVSSLSLAFGGGIGQVLGGTMVDVAANMNVPALPWVVSAVIGTLAAIGLSYFYSRNATAVNTPKRVSYSGD
ncbi:MAG: MFS transporter [Chloroflexota bacterium]